MHFFLLYQIPAPLNNFLVKSQSSTECLSWFFFSALLQFSTPDLPCKILYHAFARSTQINPFTATGYFHRQPPRWPTFLAMLFQILKEGMGLPLSDELEVQYIYHVIKSNVIQTYDGAKVTVFVRFESESARRRHVHCSCSRSDVALVEIFTGPAPID